MEEKTLATSKQNYWLAVLLAWGIPELFGFYLYFIVDEFPEDEVIRYGMILGPLACGLLVLFMLAKVELAITNKRVYGRASFGCRVDLPLDSVTAIGTSFYERYCDYNSIRFYQVSEFFDLDDTDAAHRITELRYRF